MNIVKGYLLEKFNPQILDVNYIKTHLDELDFDEITMDGYIIINTNKIEYCDKEHPIVIVNSAFGGKSLNINSEYYKEHKKEIDELIEFICRNKKSNYLGISSSILLSPSIYDAIISNLNIERISLGDNDDIVPLTTELYTMFKDTHIKSIETAEVSDELKENFDTLIEFNNNRKLVSYYKYNQLQGQSCDLLYVSTKLSNEELNNLKYLGNEVEVIFNSYDYENYLTIIKKIAEFGLTNKLTFKIKDKNEFNTLLFSQLESLTDIRNIVVDLSSMFNGKLDLLSYIKYEKRLIEMILPAINLSPFEKYLFAYNVTKKFKKYKENNNDKQSSRDLYQILDNDYMVCVGFSVVLEDLLNKLNLGNYDYSVSVDIGLDSIPNNTITLPNTTFSFKSGKEEEVLTSSANHARRIIHIVDPKYEIDGYFIADPTWDNDLENDAYNHALMTHEEYDTLDRYNYFQKTIEELLFISNIKEFYKKINIILDKSQKSPIPLTQIDLIQDFFSLFQRLDYEFYCELITKFPNKKMCNEQASDIFEFIGEHILNKINNSINAETFKSAIEFLYRNVYKYNEDELEEKVNKTMQYNKERQSIVFPTRYKIDREGNTMVIMNSKNKFDLSEEEPSKTI